MRISASHRDAMVAHAREEAPNECCGYARLTDGRVDEVFRATNELRSRYGYRLDAKSLFAANELDDAGHGVAIYHSHPRSPAAPSQTDVNTAFYPHWLYVIVSLEAGDGADAVVRAWRITDGRFDEEEVVVAPDG